MIPLRRTCKVQRHIAPSISFFLLVVLGFELRASCLLSQMFYHLSNSASSLFHFWGDPEYAGTALFSHSGLFSSFISSANYWIQNHHFWRIAREEVTTYMWWQRSLSWLKIFCCKTAAEWICRENCPFPRIFMPRCGMEPPRKHPVQSAHPYFPGVSGL
jgi:hypothetical protein